jgi:hypothetical protein
VQLSHFLSVSCDSPYAEREPKTSHDRRFVHTKKLRLELRATSWKAPVSPLGLLAPMEHLLARSLTSALSSKHAKVQSLTMVSDIFGRRRRTRFCAARLGELAESGALREGGRRG